MDKIWQANYLTVENVERYRFMMRYFYKCHRQMQGASYRPEILQMMREEFSTTYTEIEADQDLENLVTWGNLQRQQEMVKIGTVEEYRNRNFRYQITKEGLLVEEMIYQLEHIKQSSRGALDEKGFRKLLGLLQSYVSSASNRIELWQEIRSVFRQIGDDTANYIGYITSPEVDSRMKTAQFLVYKDRFVSYLRDFISSVQSLNYQFQHIIMELSKIDQQLLIDGLYEKESDIPTFDGMTKEEVAEQVAGELIALKNWFIGTAERPSEYDNLMEQTDQMITKITGLIYYYGQEIHQYQSRKKDYLYLSKWFSKAENLAEAQKMYAGIFGLSHTHHYFVSEGSDATNTRENSWELEPSVLYLNKRGRGSRQTYQVQSIKVDQASQQEKIREYKAQVIAHRKRIDSYFKDGLLDFSQIEKLDRESRQVFLKWISKAIVAQSVSNQKETEMVEQKIVTELDFEVIVMIFQGERITITCEDGDLNMPKVMMKRGVR